jgi:hypothetical protein
MAELQEMRSDQVFEARSRVRDLRPVPEVELLLLLDGADPWRAERRNAEADIEILEDLQPAFGRLVGDFELFPKVFHGQR